MGLYIRVKSKQRIGYYKTVNLYVIDMKKVCV